MMRMRIKDSYIDSQKYELYQWIYTNTGKDREKDRLKKNLYTLKLIYIDVQIRVGSHLRLNTEHGRGLLLTNNHGWRRGS